MFYDGERIVFFFFPKKILSLVIIKTAQQGYNVQWTNVKIQQMGGDSPLSARLGCGYLRSPRRGKKPHRRSIVPSKRPCSGGTKRGFPPLLKKSESAPQHLIRVALNPVILSPERVNKLSPEISECLRWRDGTTLKDPSAACPPSKP